MDAAARTLDLLRRSPGVREELLDKARRGELADLERLGVTADEVVALTEGRTPRGAPRTPGRRAVVYGVEAIVRKFGRPVLLVQHDTYAAPESETVAAELAPHRANIEAAIKRVGRLEFRNHAMPWGGTGWLVDRNIVVTNRHVAELIAESNGRGGFLFRTSPAGVPYGARLDFGEEYTPIGVAAARETPLKAIRYLARTDQPDIALFEIDVDGSLPPPLEFADAAAEDQPIGIVGYPAYDSRNDPEDVAHYFGDIFGVKRFAPGVVSQRAGDQHFFMHDATTLGGNSGSLVLDLATGRVLGLHFAGTYLVGNYAVTAAQVKRALAGLKAIVAVPTSFASNSEAPDGVHDAAFFAGRQGYEPTFLGSGSREVPLPGLGAREADAVEAVEHDGRRSRFLNYTHFSVAFSGTRRVPIFTAVNIDGARAKKIKRGNDKWFADLRLPPDLQLTSAHYGHPEIDRGHMVRREDPNWDTEEVAQIANDDTFHYTNAAPQHARLNQGRTQWLGLEDYVLSSARTHGLSISVFTGPVFRDSDPSLETGVQVPDEFWKVVVFLGEDQGLRASGYVLSQGRFIEDITESFVFGEYRTYQVPIAAIAQATGLDLQRLVDADVMTTAPLPEAALGLPRILALDRLEDMVL